MPAYAAFELNVPRALQTQLVEALSTLDPEPLTVPNITLIPQLQGIYQLVYEEEVVYVGKADDGLRKRLGDHNFKIGGRKNISPEQVRFRCLSLNANWTPMGPEISLINFYKSQGLCSWNARGFGNNDPGRNRETTNKPIDGWDVQFPIQEDWVVNIAPGSYQANQLLQNFKQQLPYTLRYQTDDPRRWRDGHQDYVDRQVVVAIANAPAQELLRTIAEQLPAGWQATRFPSHMILYREQQAYVYETQIYP